ncbi:MAG: HD domain-containing phosphohydrolase [Candidatus Ratteibacteria bacterium]
MNKETTESILYKLIFRNIPCIVFLLDKEKNIIEVNEKIEDYGLKTKDLIGENIFNLPFLNPKDLENLFNFKNKLIKIYLAFENQKRYVLAKLNELDLDNPKYLLLFHDITDQELLKIKLKEDEEIIIEWESLAEKSLAGIYVYDENYNFVYINPTFCNIIGYSKDELIGKKKSYEIVYEKDIDLVKEMAEKRFSGQIDSASFILRVKRPDEKIKYCYVSERVGRYKGKKVIVGTAIDITEKIELENKLNEEKKLLEQTLNGTIHALSKIVEIRDPYTAGHQLSVSVLAEKVAKELGLKEEEIKQILWASLLHDIGKISVPSEILVVPRKLTSIEFSIVKTHPIVAYNVLKVIPQFEKISQIVLQHHERLDGTGYPRGLKGDEILKEARIIAVCDVVDAMINHRPYRSALTLDEALNEIYMNRGLKYDEKVVDICFDLFKKKGFSFK